MMKALDDIATASVEVERHARDIIFRIDSLETALKQAQSRMLALCEAALDMLEALDEDDEHAIESTKPRLRTAVRAAS